MTMHDAPGTPSGGGAAWIGDWPPGVLGRAWFFYRFLCFFFGRKLRQVDCKVARPFLGWEVATLEFCRDTKLGGAFRSILFNPREDEPSGQQIFWGLGLKPLSRKEFMAMGPKLHETCVFQRSDGTSSGLQTSAQAH